MALAARSVTWLDFPMSKVHAGATRFSMRLKSPKNQGLRVSINGKKLERTRLTKGWQTVKLEIPAGTLKEGENSLEMNWSGMGRVGAFKASAAVQWVHLGKQALESVEADEPLRDGKLLLPANGGLAYYIQPMAKTKLRLKFAAQPEGKRCQVKVRVEVNKQPLLEETRVETARPAGSESETYVDLDRFAGKVSRLELLAAGSGCKELTLLDASLVRPGPAPTVKRGVKPKNVLFWLIDNARADRFTLYNPDTRVKTPVIEKLGKEGTVYANAYIQGIESRVSHASIWTGMYPKQHRFVAAKAKLNRGWVTLAEAAKKAGLYTAAWVANGFVSKFWGFGQGWNQFRNTMHKGGGLTGKALADHSIKFIEKKGGTSFYLYVGTIDPHVSWRGRQPWLKQYHPEPYRGRFKKNVMGPVWDKLAGNPKSASPADRKRALAIYDSTVSYNDHHLGRVLKALEAKGIRDQTMIVITADHGEELWEFGKIGHGASLREVVVNVPLIIHYPPLFGKGVRVEQGVDVLGVMATVLDALGADIPDTVQGESLLPLAHGVGAGYPRPSIASQYELAHAIRIGRWKMWVGGKGKPRLYDLSSKEKEHRRVSGAPLTRRWLTDALSTFLIYQHGWRSRHWGVATNHRSGFPKDLEAGKIIPIKPR